jgi:hypothetical protein
VNGVQSIAKKFDTLAMRNQLMRLSINGEPEFLQSDLKRPECMPGRSMVRADYDEIIDIYN